MLDPARPPLQHCAPAGAQPTLFQQSAASLPDASDIKPKSGQSRKLMSMMGYNGTECRMVSMNDLSALLR